MLTYKTISGSTLSATHGWHAATERGEFHRARDMTACSFLGNASGGTANYAPFTTGSLTLKSSWVCPKQYLALCIKAAFSRNITRVKVASIVERGVPSAVLPPAAPSYEIAIFAMGISRLPGRTKDALGGVVPWRVVPWIVDYLPGHRWRCQHRKKDCGSANQSESRHSPIASSNAQHGATKTIHPGSKPWPKSGT